MQYGASVNPVSAKQPALRRGNLGVVLSTICGAAEPVSRADVAGLTGSTRATASAHVDALLACGLVRELDRHLQPTQSSRPGRPSTPVVAGNRVAALGLQIGVKSLAARLVSLDGLVLGKADDIVDVADLDIAAALRRLARLARAVRRQATPDVTVLSGAVAIPGLVHEGRVLHAPNLGWTNLPVLERLARALPDTPLRMGNEADYAARTVALAVPGRPGVLRDFLYVSGEVGIGGAVVRDGVVTSSRGWGGEVGHVCVQPDGPVCGCGSRGCLEQYVGYAALLKAAGVSPSDGLVAVLEQADAGNERAAASLAAAHAALAVALVSVLNVIDVPAVVLGGHLGELAASDPGRLERELRDRLVVGRWAAPAVLVHAGQADAAAVGAAYDRLADVIRDPVALFPDL